MSLRKAVALMAGLFVTAAVWHAVDSMSRAWGAPEGRIVVGSTSELIHLDPLPNTFINDTNLLYVNIYDALVIRRPDGSLGPHLAESWRQITPTEWEFKLRKGVRFHNGEPFDANAMKATVDRFLDPARRRAPHIANAIKGAAVVDEHTIRITTPQPNPTLLQTALYYAFPVPPRHLQAVGDEGLAKHPIGTGPFKFVRWVKGNHMLLEANADYWKGAPKVKTVEIRLLPENATRVAALRAGEIDIAMQLSPDQIPVIQGDPNLTIAGAPVPRVIYLILFGKSPVGGAEPLGDKRVRQALNYAIDVDSIIRNILGGQAIRAATVVSPGAYGHDAAIQPYPYDVGKAKALLAEAGLANGFAIDLNVPTGGNPLKPVEVGQAIVADLAKVGIRARLQTVEPATYFTRRNERQLAPIFMWNIFDYDGHLAVWDNAHPASRNSFDHNPEIVRLVDEENSTFDAGKRRAAFRRIQEILKEESPFIALYQQNEIYGVSRRIDWTAKPGGHVFLWDTAVVRK